MSRHDVLLEEAVLRARLALPTETELRRDVTDLLATHATMIRSEPTAGVGELDRLADEVLRLLRPRLVTAGVEQALAAVDSACAGFKQHVTGPWQARHAVDPTVTETVNHQHAVYAGLHAARKELRRLFVNHASATGHAAPATPVAG